MRTRVENRPYWSERQGRGPKIKGLDLRGLKQLVLSVIRDLTERGYFQQSFGYECVDAGDVPGSIGPDREAWFLRTLHRKNVWPYDIYGTSWDEDTTFDVVEVLHDLCSAGVDGYHHTYNHCGMHYETFDEEAGRTEYRRMMNPVLARYERPLELDDQGRLVEAAPEEFRALLEAEMPNSANEEMVTQRVKDAVELFRSRNALRPDRRRAVRDLADVLEALRGTIRAEALPKDERELFNIANGFSIRHNNREQRGQYDDIIWLTWAFYVYLATIHAVVRVQARQAADDS